MSGAKNPKIFVITYLSVPKIPENHEKFVIVNLTVVLITCLRILRRLQPIISQVVTTQCNRHNQSHYTRKIIVKN